MAAERVRPATSSIGSWRACEKKWMHIFCAVHLSKKEGTAVKSALHKLRHCAWKISATAMFKQATPTNRRHQLR